MSLMRKPIELAPSAYRWLLSHRFMREEVIISVIQDFPIAVREYINDDCFKLSFNRKKDKKFVKIIIWVNETPKKYFVYKLHSRRI